MLKPWPKNSASPSCRLGSTDSAYSFRCTWSGARIMIRSASGGAPAGGATPRPCGPGGGDDPQAFGLGLRPALRALGQADAHIDAGVTQRQCVGVALAAVAQD